MSGGGEAKLLAEWQGGVLGMGTVGGMAECGEGVLTGTSWYPISGELREDGEWGVGRWGTSR